MEPHPPPHPHQMDLLKLVHLGPHPYTHIHRLESEHLVFNLNDFMFWV